MHALSKGVVVARDNKNLVAWKIGERQLSMILEL